MESAAAKITTRERLVAAAAVEFREQGFVGTDSNKIARRAGFAPQTFYRWFKDKIAIFIAVYRAWEDEERRVVGDLIAQGAADTTVVEAAIAHHRAHLFFRRSLRALAVDEPQVRAARAASRRRQVAQIAAWAPEGALSEDGIAVRILEVERLTDAIAEGEMADMGLGDAAALAQLAAIVAELRGRD